MSLKEESGLKYYFGLWIFIAFVIIMLTHWFLTGGNTWPK